MTEIKKRPRINPVIPTTASIEVRPSDLVHGTSEEDLFLFIAEMDKLCESWDFTEVLYAHFAELHEEYLKECEEVDAEEVETSGFKVHGGRHLGVVRSWMQRKALNGSEVTWSSQDHLKFSAVLTPDLFEKLAQEIRDASVREILGKLKTSQTIVKRMKSPTEETLTQVVSSFDLRFLEGELDKILEEENA